MRLPGEFLYMMENHSTALQVWKNHKVRDAHCVHLDAHLDIGWISEETAKLAAHQGQNLSRLRQRDCFLHTREGHFDIASWLGVALSAGMLSKLFWVVPDEVWFDRSQQLQELLTRQIGNISRRSFTELRRYKGPYRFMVGTTEVVVCQLDQLPSLQAGQLLLDIDLDYFARYRDPGSGGDWSEPWIDPSNVIAELHARVSRPEVTTVSLSWHGGYMPLNLLPRVLPICEDAQSVNDGEKWDGLDRRCDGPYAEYTWACGLLHRNRPTEALQFASRAVCADPQVGAYHYLVSCSAAHIGDLVGATEARDRCLSSGSVESAQVLNDFAGFSAQVGDLQDALVLQEEAFAIDQAESPIISANLMALYAQVKRWDRAQDLAHVTVGRQPFNSEAFVVLATAAQHHGDNTTAVEMWKCAAETALSEHQKASYHSRAARLQSSRKKVDHAYK